jgi:hypothetical protein
MWPAEAGPWSVRVEVLRQMRDVTARVGDPAHDDPHGEDEAADEQDTPERHPDERERDPDREQERLQAPSGKMDLLARGWRRLGFGTAHDFQPLLVETLMVAIIVAAHYDT